MIPGYDAWRLASPPEADEAVIAVECDFSPDDAEDESDDCDFSGDVDASIWDGTAEWTCPKCGNERTTDVSGYNEPDPDAAWDSRFDND